MVTCVPPLVVPWFGRTPVTAGGCGGVQAALHNRRFGLVDNWIRHIQDVRQKHAALIECSPEEKRHDLLCELNVIEQVLNAGQATVVRDAWERGQSLTIHGWIYGLHDGLLRDLKMSATNADELERAYRDAIASLG